MQRGVDRDELPKDIPIGQLRDVFFGTLEFSARTLKLEWQLDSLGLRPIRPLTYFENTRWADELVIYHGGFIWLMLLQAHPKAKNQQPRPDECAEIDSEAAEILWRLTI